MLELNGFIISYFNIKILIFLFHLFITSIKINARE